MKRFAILGLLLFVGVGLALGGNYSISQSSDEASMTCECATCCPDGGCCCGSGDCVCDDCRCNCCAAGSKFCATGCCAVNESTTSFEDGACPKCNAKSPSTSLK